VPGPQRPVVIAHRGASGAHPPGNTIEAFRAAAPLGATWVELDLRRTADGQLVVLHDAVLPDGRSLVELRAAELPDWLPTLADALDACDGLGVNIEVKNDPDEPDFDPDDHVIASVVALLRRRATGQPILLSSFRRATIDCARLVAPDIPTGLLVVRPTIDDVDWAAGRSHSAVHPHFTHVDRPIVEAAHLRGLDVNVWTVDRPADIERMVRLGVDGIVTNVPDVARAVVKRSS
jgi:glycerophosphoryl diester phosphodiesterase